MNAESDLYLNFVYLSLPHSYTPIFQTLGLLTLSHLSVLPSTGTVSTLTNGNDYYSSTVQSFLSTVRILDSSFESLSCFMSNSGSTFVSEGLLSEQTVSKCTFTNITFLHHLSTIPTNTAHYSLVYECILSHTSLDHCQDAFQGSLITGPTAQTLHRFFCANTSLTHSTVTHRPPSSLPPAILPLRLEARRKWWHFKKNEDRIAGLIEDTTFSLTQCIMIVTSIFFVKSIIIKWRDDYV